MLELVPYLHSTKSLERRLCFLYNFSKLIMDFYTNSHNIVFTTPLPDLNLISDVPKDAKILEIGSGYSRILLYLHNNGYSNLTGIECSKKLLARAKKNLINAKYICCNVLDIDLQEQFDLILICGTLEYFIGYKRYKLFNIIDKMLTPKGILYFELFTYDISCILQYINGWWETSIFGTLLLSNNLILQHTSIKQVVKAFQKIGKYSIVFKQNVKFKTWSDTEASGGILLLKKG